VQVAIHHLLRRTLEKMSYQYFPLVFYSGFDIEKSGSCNSFFPVLGYAFAALKANGRVVCWGDAMGGGDSSSVTL